MHPSDRRAFIIIGGALMLIGGSYLSFRVFGDSYLIAIFTLIGMLLVFGLIIKYLAKYNDKD
ncbi:MAG TPA: hypothetical protein VLA93_00445 [Pyrinomonadaceae bacterium]|nr:hypothetical protein [Pyrinomonadaceae bacterium]